MKKGRKKAILALLVAGCILTACQGRSAEPNEQTEESIVEIEERPTFNWKEEKWNSEFAEGKDFTVYPEKSVTTLDSEMAGNHENIYLVKGNMAYSLSSYYEKNEDEYGYTWTYYFNTYNLDTGESDSNKFEIPALQEYEGLYLDLVMIDIVNEEDKVLFIQVKEEGINQAYLAVHISADNTVKSIVDLQPALMENGVKLEGDYYFCSIHADSQGLYYAYDKWKCIVLNESGETILCIGDGKTEGFSFYACKASDGSVITLWREEIGQIKDGDAFVTVDREKGKIILAQGKIPDFAGITVDDEKGYMYYLSNNSALYRWDLISGTVQLCADMKGEGVDPKTNQILLALKSSGLPVVLSADDKMRIHATSATPVERNMEEVCIVDLLNTGSVGIGGNTFASSSVIRFAKNNVDYKLTVDAANTAGKEGQELYDVRNAFRTQMLNELVAGDMPDILFLNKEDFLMLSDKKLFADLTDFYHAELMDGIFASSQQGGVIDGKQYAIIPEASATLLLVDKSVWNKDSWTLEEAVEVMQRNKQYSSFINQRNYDRGAGILLDVFLYDLDNTPFLDLKRGTCDFTNPLFVQLLQYYKDKNYFYKSWESEDAPYEECAGFVTEISDYPEYTVVMEELDKKYRVVGIPSETGKGNYWNSFGYVAVSKDALKKQSVKDFLKYLLSKDNQRWSDYSVRNDLLDEYATYIDSDWDQGWKYMTNNGYRKFAWKEDGSSYAPEYVALMESCTYSSGNTEEIMNIVKEEIFDYFDGAQSVENTAKVIQSRVQLYLDERK